MMEKLILLTLAILLALPIVSATIADTDARFIGEQDLDLDIKEPCFNNQTYCSSTATCNITITNPNQLLLIDNLLMQNQVAFHNYTLNGTFTNITGTYEATVVCKDGSDNGFDTFNFLITPNGRKLTLEQGIIYSVIFIILIILDLAMFIGAFVIDGKNTYSFDGKLLTANPYKYIKLGLFLFGYGAMMVIFIVGETIAKNFLFLSLIGSIFHILFLISAVALLPLFLAIIGFFILRIIGDIQHKLLTKRNLPIRDTRGLKRI